MRGSKMTPMSPVYPYFYREGTWSYFCLSQCSVKKTHTIYLKIILQKFSINNNLKFYFMKKFFSLFFLCVLFVSTTFATKNCVFIVAANATADQNIIDYLNANGYAVTVFVANGTVPTGSYDLAVLSETIGSTANTWKAFRNAPLPFVALKTFAARGNANSLSWLTGNTPGTDYANTTDVTVTSAAPTHPILDGITTNPQLLYQAVPDPVTSTIICALQWVNFPTLPSGATVITTATIGTGTAYTLIGQLPQTIAFEQNTALNTARLINRAVMTGFNNLAKCTINARCIKSYQTIVRLGFCIRNCYSYSASNIERYA
jgi:hypothetical protein